MEGRTRTQALAACGQLLVPLARVLITLGISAPEFTSACKQAFVRAAVARLARSTRRLNRSRIAIVTGLTRAEVTKLLKSRSVTARTLQSHLHRARRVMNGWRVDPEFTSRKGRPRALTFRGRHRSFEMLVKRYSGDIPPRAMLDELLAMSVVRKQKNGRIQPKMRRNTPTMSVRELALFGKQGHALLDTLCRNLQDPNNQMFVGTVTGEQIDPEVLALLLQRIQKQGLEFLSRIDDQFKHPPRFRKARKPAGSSALGVTVFTYRDPVSGRRG